MCVIVDGHHSNFGPNAGRNAAGSEDDPGEKQIGLCQRSCMFVRLVMLQFLFIVSAFCPRGGPRMNPSARASGGQINFIAKDRRYRGSLLLLRGSTPVHAEPDYQPLLNAAEK